MNEDASGIEAALKFYAEPENWINDMSTTGSSLGDSEVIGSSEINQDGGMKARDALSKANL